MVTPHPQYGDHGLLLNVGSERKGATNTEKIAGKHSLVLGFGDWEGVNNQLTRTYGGLLRGGVRCIM